MEFRSIYEKTFFLIFKNDNFLWDCNGKIRKNYALRTIRVNAQFPYQIDTRCKEKHTISIEDQFWYYNLLEFPIPYHITRDFFPGISCTFMERG